MPSIGGRNAEAVRAALKAAGLRVRAAEVGGSAGRSMQVAVDGGTVTVRAVGGGVIRL
jgi:chemotaxis protein CheD